MADKELRKVIGNRAKERRLELGLSGQDIADCLGVNKSTILRYERGTIDNEKKIIIEGLADALHVSVAWLKGETEEKETIITDNRDYLIKSIFEQISGSLTFDLENKDSDFSKDVLLLLLKCYKEFSVSFERACNQYGDNADNEEIAKTIQPQFKETPLENITKIVERYKAQDTWKEDTVFEKESFELLQNILEEAGELPARVPYEDLVTTEFSEKAAK